MLVILNRILSLEVKQTIELINYFNKKENTVALMHIGKLYIKKMVD